MPSTKQPPIGLILHELPLGDDRRLMLDVVAGTGWLAFADDHAEEVPPGSAILRLAMLDWCWRHNAGADRHRPAAQPGVVALLDRGEESVGVEVEDGAVGRRHAGPPVRESRRRRLRLGGQKAPASVC